MIAITPSEAALAVATVVSFWAALADEDDTRAVSVFVDAPRPPSGTSVATWLRALLGVSLLECRRMSVSYQVRVLAGERLGVTSRRHGEIRQAVSGFPTAIRRGRIPGWRFVLERIEGAWLIQPSADPAEPPVSVVDIPPAERAGIALPQAAYAEQSLPGAGDHRFEIDQRS